VVKKSTGPVEIDNNHPAARRTLEAAWVPVVGNVLEDISWQRKYTSDKLLGSGTEAIGGAVKLTTADTYGQEYDERPYAQPTGHTVVMRLKPVQEAVGRIAFSLRYGSSPFSQFNLSVNGYYSAWSPENAWVNSQGRIGSFYTVNPNPHGHAYAGTSALTGDWQTIAVTIKHGTAPRLFVDGRRLSTTNYNTVAIADVYNSGQHAGMGAQSDLAAGANVFNGLIESCFWWTEALSDDMVESLTADPYQILRPAIPAFAFGVQGTSPGADVDNWIREDNGDWVREDGGVWLLEGVAAPAGVPLGSLGQVYHLDRWA
jgi:hypothetical protein